MNAVIYARYSSAGQRDVSIEDQVREIKQYAEHHNYTIIKIYADRAMTGRNDNRPQFRKMIADAEKHKFQAVLVYKHDRFARNQYDSVIYKKRLRDNGVELIAVTEPIPDGHGAMILESIYVAMAEEYSNNLSQNVKRGQKGNALRCMANHIPTFGYRTNKETRKFEIDPATAPIVQKVFAMSIAGKTQKEILDSIGIKRSKNWLHHVLHNERYTGVYIHGDVRIDGGMPQLVSKNDFERAKEIMLQRQHHPQAKPYRYLLSGKVYCGYCNHLMAGESATSHTGTLYRYYTCTTSKKHLQCAKRRIQAATLENKIIEALKDTIFTDEILDRLVNDVCNYLKTNNSLPLLKERLADTEKRIKNIQSNIERVANVPETLINRMCELEEIKNELSDRIKAEQLTIDSVDKNDLTNVIRNFSNASNASLISTFVTRITAFDDYAIIEYDASGDNTIRIDFVHDEVWRNTLSPCTKFYVYKSTVFIKIKLVA